MHDTTETPVITEFLAVENATANNPLMANMPKADLRLIGTSGHVHQVIVPISRSAALKLAKEILLHLQADGSP
jgi:hypothetical protein